MSLASMFLCSARGLQGAHRDVQLVAVATAALAFVFKLLGPSAPGFTKLLVAYSTSGVLLYCGIAALRPRLVRL